MARRGELNHVSAGRSSASRGAGRVQVQGAGCSKRQRAWWVVGRVRVVNIAATAAVHRSCHCHLGRLQLRSTGASAALEVRLRVRVLCSVGPASQTPTKQASTLGACWCCH
jgi:hypothetical protein